MNMEKKTTTGNILYIFMSFYRLFEPFESTSWFYERMYNISQSIISYYLNLFNAISFDPPSLVWRKPRRPLRTFHDWVEQPPFPTSACAHVDKLSTEMGARNAKGADHTWSEMGLFMSVPSKLHGHWFMMVHAELIPHADWLLIQYVRILHRIVSWGASLFSAVCFANAERKHETCSIRKLQAMGSSWTRQFCWTVAMACLFGSLRILMLATSHRSRFCGNWLRTSKSWNASSAWVFAATWMTRRPAPWKSVESNRRKPCQKPEACGIQLGLISSTRATTSAKVPLSGTSFKGATPFAQVFLQGLLNPQADELRLLNCFQFLDGPNNLRETLSIQHRLAHWKLPITRVNLPVVSCCARL